MKVFVIGGTGAFGARLCILLARDGHEVTVASRRGRARTGGPDLSKFQHVTFDRDGALEGLAGHDVIVDAAGPFHAYGADPYRIARAAIAHGAHYFDLSDNADFCQGIKGLDAAAQAAGVCVASGMSSVPGVSSAAVAGLCDGARPLSIDSAILPGNRAPRGRAVVASILHQTGTTYHEVRGGNPVPVRSWSDPQTYDLAGDQRQAWSIEVPDQRLFPEHFDCPTVTFRAGLELGLMRYGLAALSWLRGKFGFGMPPWAVSAVMGAAKVLAPFGTDTGGMVVRVVVPKDTGFERRTWTLLADAGEGPYVPAIAVRAACRDIEALPVGAGPAVGLIPLERIEVCFDDLAITTTRTADPVSPPFRGVLGTAFDSLAPAVRRTHDAVTPRHFKGLSRVTRGTGLQARLAALLFGFPPSGDAVPVSVSKTPVDGGEVWVRRFGSATFRSVLRPTARGMSERFGPLTFDLDLAVNDGRLHYPVKGGRCLGIPIPRALLPQSEAVEYDTDGRFHFDVNLKAPTGATLVHYRGWLEPDPPSGSPDHPR